MDWGYYSTNYIRKVTSSTHGIVSPILWVFLFPNWTRNIWCRRCGAIKAAGDGCHGVKIGFQAVTAWVYEMVNYGQFMSTPDITKQWVNISTESIQSLENICPLGNIESSDLSSAQTTSRSVAKTSTEGRTPVTGNTPDTALEVQEVRPPWPQGSPKRPPIFCNMLQAYAMNRCALAKFVCCR